ncbi:TonB-dependent receptor plug domain-containing protein [Sphingomonas glaciei]|uniref:TonB-dependent receptor n=1 Tax=Sphingomonas glaciei TaxID=2938948 RepID=A0ABY5MVW2_9SPHN|nr:TonB-dependent receptor [Sphingomonas glaciei]UUR08604.1 TonB-dependent receptor [Sphingomonas glaciei]
MFLTDLPPPPVAAETIIVTAARGGEQRGKSPASVSLIEPVTVERLGEPLLATLLRLTPSASLSVAGPAGSQTQVRLRGAEANHTLLFIDGIRANDPAAGNEPRFELLSADLADRIEIVRGPQSALWGSEAIGGVIALSAQPRTGVGAVAEAGSQGFGRLGGSAGYRQGQVSLGLGGGIQGARGINAFAGGPGDRDGYRNAVLRGRLDWASGPLTLTASGFGIAATSEFDGSDPATFLRADTADSTRNRLAAGRLGARYDDGGWKLALGVSRLGSRNRNLLADVEQNRTSGRRDTLNAEAARDFGSAHRLTVAGEWIGERFTASDTVYGGFTNQRRKRDQAAVTAEYRGETGPVVATLAIRHDAFSEFRDATTFRAGALVALGGGLQLAGSWGEGIAQPTFFDLYGFFPGSYVGNPALKPERSRGGELSLRAISGPWRAAVTAYRQRLRDEIVASPDFTSAVNASGRSKRDGVELEAGWHGGEWLNLSATYAYLDAVEPAGRELRRPRHSGSVAADGVAGRLSYGAALSYTGTRLDRDFDQFPSPLVRLPSNWLASAQLAYRVAPQVELFGRVANAFDRRVVDVVGYRAEGRSLFAGIRLGPRR